MNKLKITLSALIIFTVFLTGCQLTKSKKSSASSPASGIYKPGTYATGKNIKAGEYVIEPAEKEPLNISEFTVNSSSADSSSQTNIGDMKYYGRVYVTLHDGQSIVLKSGIMHYAETYKNNLSTQSEYDVGMYKIGTDIPIGNYILYPDTTDKQSCIAIYDQQDIYSSDNSITGFQNFLANVDLVLGEAQIGKYVYINDGYVKSK